MKLKLFIVALFCSVVSWGQVSLTNGSPSSTINFSSTVAGVSNGAYNGTGFQATPTAGRLDSDAWAVTGWSDGVLAFAGTQTTATTDYTRGATAIAVTTGGFYSFTGAPHSVANPCFMIQPGGSDFAPGALTLRVQNSGTTNITQIDISYDIFVRNDQGRSSSFNFSYSSDNSTYTAVAALDYTSIAAVDALGWVQVGTAPSRSTLVTGLNIAPGAFFYIRWNSADVGGAGSRDEFGLDNISLSASFATGCSAPTTQASVFTSSSIAETTATTGWIRGNGNNVLVVARSGGAVNADPVNGVTYTANAAFGLGTQIGTGNFVVYNGSGNSVNLTALTAGTTYHFAVYEYNTTGVCYNLSELTGSFTTLLPAPVITSSLTASGSQGSPFTYTIVATNTPTSYSATGLPAGLSINTTTGVISGIPTVSGSFNVTITATNGTGTDTETLVITLGTGPCVTANFESGNPAGWIINATALGGQNCEGSQGLVFNDVNDNVITPLIVNPQSLTFSKKRSSNTTAWTLNIEASTSTSGPWTSVYTTSTISTTCEFTTVDLSAYNTGSYYFRLIDQRTTGNNERTLDDIQIYCGLLCTPPSDPSGTISGVNLACESTTLSFSGSASSPIVYYWQNTSNGISLANNANSNLIVTTSGNYFVRAYNSATSCWSINSIGPYTVTINNNPVITTQPINASAIVNGSASFSIATFGAGLSYQWQVNTGSGFVNLTNSAPYSNVTGTTLNISAVTLAMNGYQYRCVVNATAPCSSVTSNSALLTVTPALGTVFKPGELVFVGYDGQYLGSGFGAHDQYLVATMVDITPGTTFLIVNSRYEAGAPANVRTDKWGGSGDFAEEAPAVVSLTYNGAANIPAGSVIKLNTDSSANVFGEIGVITGTTETNRTSDFSKVLPFGGPPISAPNISSGGSDQLYLAQGAFTFDGTINVGEANYYLSGTLLHGLTNRTAWVPITSACNGDDSGGNTRESRLPAALTCFNVENVNSNAISGYYENDKQHGIATIRQIIQGISDVGNNWTLSTGRYTLDATSNAVNRAGRTFQIGPSNPAGQWVGNVDTNWFNCANWEGLAVPSFTTDVTVSTSALNNAVIDYNAAYSDEYSDIAYSNNLTITGRKVQLQASLNNILEVHGNLQISGTGILDMDDSTVAADGQLYLFGNWINNLGNTAFEEGHGTVHFTGISPQIINNVTPLGTEVFYNVVLNNSFDTSVSNDLVAEGNLVINAGKVLTIDGAGYVRVNNKLTHNGDLSIQNNGQFIQVNETDSNDGVYTGTKFQVDRTAQVRNLDYVFWSSPVENFGVNSLPNSNRYFWSTLAANTNGTQGNWATASGNMTKGQGYIARASNGAVAAQALNHIFAGKPNNGAFTLPIQRGNFNGADFDAEPANSNNVLTTKYDDNWNLVGNPYPSAIDAEEFLVSNQTKIEGAVWVWTHGLLPTSITDPFYNNYLYNYTATDYIKYNGLGSTDPDTFAGKLASGQGFMVNMLHTAATPNTIDFANSFRTGAAYANYNNSDFFRSSVNEIASFDNQEKHRMWLDVINTSTGHFDRTLLGYASNATDKRDHFYDCIHKPNNTVSFYSLIEKEPFIIQGRKLPFDVYDKVPMGLNVAITGTLTIAIYKADGIFSQGQTIYLEDKYLNIIHNLSLTPYTFTANSGVFTDRFVIRYTNETLGGNDFVNESDVLISSSDVITVYSNTTTIQSIQIHNVLGQLLVNEKNVNADTFEINTLQKNKAPLIIQVTLENGKKIAKKLIF